MARGEPLSVVAVLSVRYLRIEVAWLWRRPRFDRADAAIRIQIGDLARCLRLSERLDPAAVAAARQSGWKAASGCSGRSCGRRAGFAFAARQGNAGGMLNCRWRRDEHGDTSIVARWRSPAPRAVSMAASPGGRGAAFIPRRWREERARSMPATSWFGLERGLPSPNGWLAEMRRARCSYRALSVRTGRSSPPDTWGRGRDRRGQQMIFVELGDRGDFELARSSAGDLEMILDVVGGSDEKAATAVFGHEPDRAPRRDILLRRRPEAQQVGSLFGPDVAGAAPAPGLSRSSARGNSMVVEVIASVAGSSGRRSMRPPLRSVGSWRWEAARRRRQARLPFPLCRDRSPDQPARAVAMAHTQVDLGPLDLVGRTFMPLFPRSIEIGS